MDPRGPIRFARSIMPDRHSTPRSTPTRRCTEDTVKTPPWGSVLGGGASSAFRRELDTPDMGPCRLPERRPFLLSHSSGIATYRVQWSCSPRARCTPGKAQRRAPRRPSFLVGRRRDSAIRKRAMIVPSQSRRRAGARRRGHVCRCASPRVNPRARNVSGAEERKDASAACARGNRADPRVIRSILRRDATC
jgi:hypothetical protein